MCSTCFTTIWFGHQFNTKASCKLYLIVGLVLKNTGTSWSFSEICFMVGVKHRNSSKDQVFGEFWKMATQWQEKPLVLRMNIYQSEIVCVCVHICFSHRTEQNCTTVFALLEKNQFSPTRRFAWHNLKQAKQLGWAPSFVHFFEFHGIFL